MRYRSIGTHFVFLLSMVKVICFRICEEVITIIVKCFFNIQSDTPQNVYM